MNLVCVQLAAGHCTSLDTSSAHGNRDVEQRSGAFWDCQQDGGRWRLRPLLRYTSGLFLFFILF